MATKSVPDLGRYMSRHVRIESLAEEVNKTLKYKNIVSGVNEIGRQIAAMTREPRSTACLRWRISVEVQSRNA